MPVEMLLDLPLGLGHEAETHFVAGARGEQANGERSAVPQRIQQADAPAQLLDAPLSPGEVIRLFAGGPLEQGPQPRISRSQCLRIVERLRAHLSNMIDAHQCRRMSTVGLGQVLVLQIACRAGRGSHRPGSDGTQRPVCSGQQ